MADIKGILKINNTGNGVLDSYVTNTATNNLSTKPFTIDILSVVKNFPSNINYGAIGTPIGNTRINNLRFGVVDQDGIRTQKYNGLDFGFTDSNNYYNLTITITGTDIISFKIIFDPLRNQYPTNYNWVDVDGVTHTITGNTSNEILFEQNAGYGTTIINFSEWNLPNTMIGISFIENVEIDLFLNKNWIVSFESLSQSTNDGSQLIFTPMASSGQIILKDIDNSLYNRAERGHLNNNVFSLELFLNNKLFHTHISNDSPYYSSDNTIKIELSDTIELWNNIEVLENTFGGSTNMSDVLAYIFDFYETDYLYSGNVTFGTCYYIDSNGQEINAYISQILIGTSARDLNLKKGTIMEQIKKICTAFLLNCYVDDRNTVHFVSARPKKTKPQEKYCKIPFKNQFKKLDYDILVKNTYDDLEIK